MKTVDAIIVELKKISSAKSRQSQAHFGISGVQNLGLTVPQMRSLAKKIGIDHALALELWQTKIHEAKHVAVMIADSKHVDEKLMKLWMKDFDSWDIVDNCCSTLFRKHPLAFEKAVEWCEHKKEFEKRAGFTMMAQLAVHDKKAEDKLYEQFLPIIKKHSDDERNFVRKANNWALRQIGKRNERLCKKAIATAKDIFKKGDASSRWIATDALRELEMYLKEGKIKRVGVK